MTGLSVVVMVGAYLGNVDIFILILVWIFELEREQTQLTLYQLIMQRQLAGDWWEKDQLTE